MPKRINLIISLLSINKLVFCCPTCIGLPRSHERPFFERKSFLAALQQTNTQKQPEKNTKTATEKNSSEKTPQ
jgi:hypothetical protein